MKIIEPQSAILSNAEVLAHFTLNPPRTCPNPTPEAPNFIPSPDLRDHNTVVKEFHNYVARVSPHLMKYPSFNPPTSKPADSTPLDNAIKTLIISLKRFNLTKAEVLMIINLGVGVFSVFSKPSDERGEESKDAEMDGEGIAEGEEGADDYGSYALLDSLIEDREDRLSDEDVGEIIKITREVFGPAQGV